MKAITLRHPWPFCVCCLGKRIVNVTRTPKLKVGDRFAIHGGKVPTGHDLATVKMTLEAIEKDHGRVNGDITLHDIIMPGIVAIATFGGITLDGRGECDCGRIEHGRCHSACPSQRVDPWFDTLTRGNRGWFLRDVLVLPEPIPCKGAQGLWAVPDDVLRQIGEDDE